MLQFDEEAIAWTCNSLQKNNSEIQILKLLKEQKILKNQTAYKLLKQNKIYMTKQ